MEPEKTKYVELWLGYFKQGDDLYFHLKETDHKLYPALKRHEEWEEDEDLDDPLEYNEESIEDTVIVLPEDE